MSNRLKILIALICMLLFSIAVKADGSVPTVSVNGAEIDTSVGFVLHSDTLYASADTLSDLFKLTLSIDEFNIVHTFSTPTRMVTYDAASGSVNISDRRSFSYRVEDSAYPSYYNNGEFYIPFRMLCNSIGFDLYYDSIAHAVRVTRTSYYRGLYNAEGLAIVYKGFNYGVVDRDGNLILPITYDDISNYDSPSLFKLTDNHKCGLANKNGDIIADLLYNEISYISDGEIYLYKGDYKGMCDIYGNMIVPPEYDDIVYSGNKIAMVKDAGKWQLLYCNRNELSPVWYDEVYEITEGIQTDNSMIKGYYVLKGGKWGCIDSFGNTVIDFRYDALDKFDERGRARVIYNGKFGIIDCGGKIIIPPAYDYLYPFGKLSVTVAILGNRYGAIDTNGSVEIPFEYDHIYSFNNSPTTVAYKDKKFSVISADGQILSDKKYLYIEEFRNGLALAYSSGYGYIDHMGNEVIPCIHSEIKQGTALSVFLKKDNKWALFSPAGDNLTGYIYSNAGEFENGLSAVSIRDGRNDIYGYVNDSGDVIIPFKYSSAQKFKYGRAIVSNGSAYGIIDIEDRTVIPFEYSGFNPSYDYNVIAAANKSSKWGLIDFGNNILSDFIYDYIFDFNDDHAAVLYMNKYGVIDTSGRLVVDVNYSSAEEALAQIK